MPHSAIIDIKYAIRSRRYDSHGRRRQVQLCAFVWNHRANANAKVIKSEPDRRIGGDDGVHNDDDDVDIDSARVCSIYSTAMTLCARVCLCGRNFQHVWHVRDSLIEADVHAVFPEEQPHTVVRSNIHLIADVASCSTAIAAASSTLSSS